MSDFVVRNNEADKRYEVNVDGHIAYLAYMPAGSSTVLSHTEVPTALEGQGIGGRLVRHVLDEVREQGKKIVPTCPFVIAYIGRHPEYRELVLGYRPK